ncbi:MAG: cysteine--tRNA ligase [Candidatus Omnitrophica bacterium]|nr:cysteine--tRNA ligase [Candidatus Omnitrophota bacterium]
MSIYVYNSLTGKKEEFTPFNPDRVSMYTCGITVYDECHIGHLRSLYTFEVIRNYLEFRGFKVKWVRNITDIDDKIINRSQELKIDWQELVDRYIKDYHRVLEVFGLERADFEPRATGHISSMIKNIELLINRGYAYTTSTGVYFNVRKFLNYGRLSRQNLEQMYKGVRIESDETKQDPLDFALWKFSRHPDPYWDSPWGKGRPGWHIECSTMAIQYLGDTLDIHGGGRDLIFPHHENEIAQSEAITAKPFARYWIHHGLLTINGQKMAKSLGNFITLKDILERYHPDVLKFLFLSAHYSHPLDFSWERLEEYNRVRMRFINLGERLSSIGLLREKERYFYPNIDSLKEEFIQAMDDDFNTAKAMAVLFKILNLIETNLIRYKENIDLIIYGQAILLELLKIFKISLPIEPMDRKLLEKIELRNKLRESRQFLEADRIREELKQMGIVLEDTRQGTIYRRL